jgi:hypothetical protein
MAGVTGRRAGKIAGDARSWLSQTIHLSNRDPLSRQNNVGQDG